MFVETSLKLGRSKQTDRSVQCQPSSDQDSRGKYIKLNLKLQSLTSCETTSQTDANRKYATAAELFYSFTCSIMEVKNPIFVCTRSNTKRQNRKRRTASIQQRVHLEPLDLCCSAEIQRIYECITI